MPDPAARLAALRRRFGPHAYASDAPAEGTDPTGVATVTVDPSGLITRISLTPAEHPRAAEVLADQVLQGYVAAQLARASACVRASGREAALAAAEAEQRPLPSPARARALRLDEVHVSAAELAHPPAVLDLGDEDLPGSSLVEVPGAAGTQVRVTVSGLGTLRSVHLDPDWLDGTGDDRIVAMLQQALDQAYERIG